ncbi:MAG TPA: SRPBCC family protein [Polyangia bacterium]|nr:SRPBCC family protein [Polyangia bacterium]
MRFAPSLTFALLLAGCLSTASPAAPPAGTAPPPGAAQGDDTDVAFVQTSATIRVHARRETVWALLTSCATALELVQGLKECQVLDTAADGSWQLVKQVIDYSWYVPKLTYIVRDTYDYPERILIQRDSGDLRTLKATWYLEADGEFTVLRYSLEITPGFWVPRWLVRIALKHDLPKILRTLRIRAESSVGPSK